MRARGIYTTKYTVERYGIMRSSEHKLLLILRVHSQCGCIDTRWSRGWPGDGGSSPGRVVWLACSSRIQYQQTSIADFSGVSRIFVRGVLSFGLLYDCACVNPKCYSYDFRTRRGPRQVVVL